MRSLFLVLLLFAACAGPLAAQAVPADTGRLSTLREGQRVRLLVPAVRGKPLTGTYAGTRADSVLLLRKERMLAIPAFRVERADTTTGRSPLHGMMFGTVAGAATGLLVMLVNHPDRADIFHDDPDPARYEARNVVMGASLGAAMGLAIGVERWGAVYHQPQVRVGASGGGASVALSIPVP